MGCEARWRHRLPRSRICGILARESARQTQEPRMYQNTLFEPIYGHSDWGSALIAFFIIAVSLGSSWAVGSVAVRFSKKD